MKNNLKYIIKYIMLMMVVVVTALIIGGKKEEAVDETATTDSGNDTVAAYKEVTLTEWTNGSTGYTDFGIEGTFHIGWRLNEFDENGNNVQGINIWHRAYNIFALDVNSDENPDGTDTFKTPTAFNALQIWRAMPETYGGNANPYSDEWYRLEEGNFLYSNVYRSDYGADNGQKNGIDLTNHTNGENWGQQISSQGADIGVYPIFAQEGNNNHVGEGITVEVPMNTIDKNNGYMVLEQEETIQLSYIMSDAIFANVVKEAETDYGFFIREYNYDSPQQFAIWKLLGKGDTAETTHKSYYDDHNLESNKILATANAYYKYWKALKENSSFNTSGFWDTSDLKLENGELGPFKYTYYETKATYEGTTGTYGDIIAIDLLKNNR